MYYCQEYVLLLLLICTATDGAALAHTTLSLHEQAKFNDNGDLLTYSHSYYVLSVLLNEHAYKCKFTGSHSIKEDKLIPQYIAT